MVFGRTLWRCDRSHLALNYRSRFRLTQCCTVRRQRGARTLVLPRRLVSSGGSWPHACPTPWPWHPGAPAALPHRILCMASVRAACLCSEPSFNGCRASAMRSHASPNRSTVGQYRWTSPVAYRQQDCFQWPLQFRVAQSCHGVLIHPCRRNGHIACGPPPFLLALYPRASRDRSCSLLGDAFPLGNRERLRPEVFKTPRVVPGNHLGFGVPAAAVAECASQPPGRTFDHVPLVRGLPAICHGSPLAVESRRIAFACSDRRHAQRR